MKFVWSGLQVPCQEVDEALADPEGLSWQVLSLLCVPLTQVARL